MVKASEQPKSAVPHLDGYHGFINLGSGGRRPTEEFDAYGETFRKAGQTLAQSLDDNPTYDPFEACPIIYSYRQAIELYFKAILRAGQALLKLDGETLKFDQSILINHRLSPFLRPLRVLYQQFGWSHSYEDCASFVTSIEEIDPLSFAWRYPVDKEGRRSLPENLVFNVLDFAQRAERVLEILYEVLHGIEHSIEQTTEYLSNFEDDWCEYDWDDWDW